MSLCETTQVDPVLSYSQLGREHCRPGIRVVTYACGHVYVLARDAMVPLWCHECALRGPRAAWAVEVE